MSESLLENYHAKHRHPVNRLLHTIGIPMIVLALPALLLSWRLALAMFVFGWVLQFLGHFIEGNQPAFFRNPMYLLVGPVWFVTKLWRAFGFGAKPARIDRRIER